MSIDFETVKNKFIYMVEDANEHEVLKDRLLESIMSDIVAEVFGIGHAYPKNREVIWDLYAFEVVKTDGNQIIVNEENLEMFLLLNQKYLKV